MLKGAAWASGLAAASGFAAARNEGTLAAFRLTDQQRKQYSGFSILKPSAIASGVCSADLRAVAAAVEQGFLSEQFPAMEPYKPPPRPKKKPAPAPDTASAAAVQSERVPSMSKLASRALSTADSAALASALEPEPDLDAAIAEADGRLIEAAVLLRLAAATTASSRRRLSPLRHCRGEKALQLAASSAGGRHRRRLRCQRRQPPMAPSGNSMQCERAPPVCGADWRRRGGRGVGKVSCASRYKRRGRGSSAPRCVTHTHSSTLCVPLRVS